MSALQKIKQWFCSHTFRLSDEQARNAFCYGIDQEAVCMWCGMQKTVEGVTFGFSRAAAQLAESKERE